MMHSVLIVGLGAIAMGYDLGATASDFVLTHAKAFSLHPDFRLAGGVDADPARCALFEKHYGATAGTDLVAALATTRPDVVVIAVPTTQHAAVLKAVLQYGKPKLILCEKPLSYDLAEAAGMVEACRTHRCLLYVNYLRRVDPGVGALPGSLHVDLGVGQELAVGRGHPQVDPVVGAVDQAVADLGDRGHRDAVGRQEHAGRALDPIAGGIDRRQHACGYSYLSLVFNRDY